MREIDHNQSPLCQHIYATGVLDLYDNFTSITSSRISISEVKPKNLASSRTPAMKKKLYNTCNYLFS